MSTTDGSTTVLSVSMQAMKICIQRHREMGVGVAVAVVSHVWNE